MIDSLHVSIATFLGIKTDRKVLIEEIVEDDYSRAIRDINDPLVPVKAHGFVQLRKLIEKKDLKCMQNLSKVTEWSLRGIKSEDSYLYMAAINCMIALTVFDPKSTLDPLMEHFMSANKLNAEDRLKIGEVLTRTIRIFNELVPMYAPKLVDAFLWGLRVSDDEIFKSSCLSNLGETCKLLNFSIQVNINEILNCLSCLLETDKSVQVKRSAIMVLKMIVEGLKKDNFVQVLGTSITALYKLLVKVKNTTHDDVIRLNCQLTRSKLNIIIFTTSRGSKKKQEQFRCIRILYLLFLNKRELVVVHAKTQSALINKYVKSCQYSNIKIFYRATNFSILK
ncbi:transport and Golgi organization 6 -like protein [Brachionus plicatilis]|uniref:Transport and Golgi organization 6-like protein n=1 Tax=Brachionus plicatilis TaxID=10195 RepID=A0A3M7Q507_BRAPC|nr:transport and Golgi organization 6 -like protein [Brachionus plicatilis]